MVAIPIKLNNDPILEALVELRFTKSTMPVCEILTGFLFSALKSSHQNIVIKKLPISQIPSEIRSNDPNLTFAPLTQIICDQFGILIGDQVCTITCQKPYKGWPEFKKFIISVLEILKKSGLISEIQRYSIKYVNLIPETVRVPLKTSLAIGDLELAEAGKFIRAEIRNSEFVTILNIQFNITLVLENRPGELFKGTVLDIDTIVEHNREDFFSNHETLLDKARNEEKKIFYSVITKDALDSFQPTF